MSAFLFIWKKVKFCVFAILGIFSVGLAIWFSAKKTGKSEEKVKQAEEKAEKAEVIAAVEIAEQKAESEREVKTVRIANEVLHETVSAPIDVVRDKLRDKWTRD